ncbi:hypothetical protein SDC9_142406 [bioreactor metagenome]|uniref:Uncharacterized protein n=1 Tax=bioreactor metagenome TaxID=1076179 RepID=A0A645E3V9_9ZZZZ
MEQLDHQRTIRLQMVHRKVHGQLDQVGNPRRVRGLYARQVGRHVRDHHVHRPPTHGLLQLRKHRILPEITLDVLHAFNRLHRQQIEGDDHAIELARRRARGRKAAAHILTPGTGCGAQIHHHMAGADQVELLVDLLELVGRAGAITLFLGQLHIGIVDVLIEPGLVDLLAFGLDFHSVSGFRASNRCIAWASEEACAPAIGLSTNAESFIRKGKPRTH